MIDNLAALPAWRYIMLVRAWFIERIPSDKLSDWETELAELLPWQDVDSEAGIEIESESFMANYNRQS